MARDTADAIVGKVELHCPMAGGELARVWVTHAFRDIAERRPWSWLIRQGRFYIPAAYTTGTVSIAYNTTTLTIGGGGSFAPEMVGRQIKIGTQILTLVTYNSTTSMEVDMPWPAATVSGSAFTIFKPYVTPPDDFHYFLGMWNPDEAYRLWLDVTQEELSAFDPQRASTGQPYLVASLDTEPTRLGQVDAPLQVRGTGAVPGSSGAFSGPTASLFTIEITLAGIEGVAQYKWKKDSGSYTTGVLSDAALTQALSHGVEVYWPAGTYNLGDVFVIRTSVGAAAGLPRYELYPHPTSALTLNFLYVARADDLFDSGMSVPRYIRGDVLATAALAQAARWPGPTKEERNPYFQIALAESLEGKAERQVNTLEVQDNEVYERMISYTRSIPYHPGGSWLQSHLAPEELI